jgi:hypothetical protein
MRNKEDNNKTEQRGNQRGKRKRKRKSCIQYGCGGGSFV